jgi:hypothetical protein
MATPFSFLRYPSVYFCPAATAPSGELAYNFNLVGHKKHKKTRKIHHSRLSAASPSMFNKAPQVEGEPLASRLYLSFVVFALFGC